jgi:hypothetical protein
MLYCFWRYVFLNTPSCSVLAWRPSDLVFCPILTKISMLGEFHWKSEILNFSKVPLANSPCYMQSGGYGEPEIHCSCVRLWCSANCYWQLFAFAYYVVSDAVLVFLLHICQADFTDIVSSLSTGGDCQISFSTWLSESDSADTLMARHNLGDPTSNWWKMHVDSHTEPVFSPAKLLQMFTVRAPS